MAVSSRCGLDAEKLQFARIALLLVLLLCFFSAATAVATLSPCFPHLDASVSPLSQLRGRREGCCSGMRAGRRSGEVVRRRWPRAEVEAGGGGD